MVTVDQVVRSAVEIEGVGLPRECYVAQEFYEFELDVIFTREWLCVGRADQIAEPGDYFATVIADDPLLIVRDEQQEVRAMSAVCRHRGMVIADGSGSCDGLLICPYHSWSYDTQGRLVGAPDMTRTPGFDKSRVRLPELRAEVWKGFVFVNYDLDAAPLAPRLEEVAPILENYGVEEMVSLPPKEFDFECNWKIVMENAIECYHCSRIHRGFHDCAPSRNVLAEPLPESDSVIVLSVRTTHPDAAFVPPDFKALFPALPRLSDAERGRMTWVAIPPNLVLSCQPDNVHYFLWQPRGPEMVTLKVGWIYPETTLALPDFQQRFHAQLEGQTPIVEQDNLVCKEVQRGLKSRLAARGPFSWEEETVAHFDRWLVRRYRRAQT